MNRIVMMRRPAIAMAVVAFMLRIAPCLAAPVAIVNGGFESLYFGGNLPPQYAGDVPATAFPVGAAPSGWQAYGAVGGNAYVGVLNPGVLAEEPLATGFPAGAPEGDNVVLTFFDGHAGGAEFGVQQTLAATLAANTIYTLRVEVGNIASGISAVQPYASFGFFDLRGFPGYRIELLADGAPIAVDDDTLQPDEGMFQTSTVRLVVDADHPQLGQQLGVRLVNLNQQDIDDPVIDLEVDFDDVRLDASPLSPADFDQNGDVDGDDLAAWEGGFGTTGAAATNAVGNADADDDVDGADLLVWQREVTSGGAVAAAAAVPEPGALLLLVVAAWGLALIGRISAQS